MLSTLRLQKFKCFKDVTIPFRAENILIGRNNAGKSSVVEALRVIALIRNRCEHLRFTDPPYWSEFPPRARGVAPAVDDLDLNFETLFHRYGDPPARITATFSNGTSIEVRLGYEDDEGLVHGVLRDKRGRPINSAAEVRSLGLPSIAILPQVGPLNKKEVILDPAYVQRSLSSSLAPNHFRNQINILYQYYGAFRRIAEETWPGLRVIEFKGRGGERQDPLSLLVQSDDFVAEVSWMGHGLQMWLQTMWFLARSKSSDVVMLDEPDVYMHPDLQRRLIRFLRGRHPQAIVTTHSVEILSEITHDKILMVDKRRQTAGFADSMEALQTAVDRLGATQNLQLSRLWTSKKLLLVEGKDVEILRYFHSLIFPESLESFASQPNLSIGGWSGWQYAVGSAMLIKNAVGEDIRTYCLLDSDFHTPEEIASRLHDASAKRVTLHVWERKEIENYLLVPSLIRRVISRLVSKCPSEEEIAEELDRFAEYSKDEVQDCFAESYYLQDRSKGTASANQKARELINGVWAKGHGAHRVSGKSAISHLSKWSKDKFGASFGMVTLLREARRNEIDDELVRVLSAIEESSDF